MFCVVCPCDRYWVRTHIGQISFCGNLFVDHLMAVDLVVASGQLTEDPDLAIISV